MADDPNAIRADIAETRERMSSTLEEIGERLNPQVLKENVKESIREATIGRVSSMARQAADTVSRTTSGVTSTIRENPIPLAMVAVGIGWMIWNSRASQEDRNVRYYGSLNAGYGDDYGTGYVSSYGGTSDESYDSFGATTGAESQSFGEPQRGRVDRAKERARDLSHAASQRATELADRARGAATNVKQRTQQMAGTVADTTRRQAVRVEDAYYTNPLAMGAVALAVGLAAGLAAPVTDREIRLMGDARDKVVDRVKDLADETREKAERVVSHVAEEAKFAAREEGLTGPA